MIAVATGGWSVAEWYPAGVAARDRLAALAERLDAVEVDSSFYALPGKILEGFSGFVVDAIGYNAFFVYTASLSLPGLLLLYVLARRGAFTNPAATATPNSRTPPSGRGS